MRDTAASSRPARDAQPRRFAAPRWHRSRLERSTHARACRLRRRGRDRGRCRSTSRSTSALGLPGCHIVGLPDAGVREGRVRIRGALENSGFKLPPRRITVNLAPADLRKDGAAFDVPIAVGMLCAAGVVDAGGAGRARCSSASWRSTARCARCAACCRSPPGRARSGDAPPGRAARATPREAAVVGGDCEVEAAVGTWASWSASCAASRRREHAPRRRRRVDAGTVAAPPDLADVRGQEVAAARAGDRGGGRPQPALRRPARLGQDDAGAAAARHPAAADVRRGAGDDDGLLRSPACSAARALVARAPVSRAAPHGVRRPGWSAAARSVRPGEIALAHNGVLFLDELLEFPRPVLEALRQPLEDRTVTHRARAARRHLPGRLHAGRGAEPLPVRLPRQRAAHLHLLDRRRSARYRARLSGPLLDRIDLHVDVPAAALPASSPTATPGEPTAAVRARVAAARERQRRARPALERAPRRRRAGRASRRSTPPGTALLERAAERLGLSARAITRVRRVARTIADLEGSDRRPRRPPRRGAAVPRARPTHRP